MQDMAQGPKRVSRAMCDIWGSGVGEATLLRRVRWDLETGAVLPLVVQRAWLVWGITHGLFYT